MSALTRATMNLLALSQITALDRAARREDGAPPDLVRGDSLGVVLGHQAAPARPVGFGFYDYGPDDEDFEDDFEDDFYDSPFEGEPELSGDDFADDDDDEDDDDPELAGDPEYDPDPELSGVHDDDLDFAGKERRARRLRRRARRKKGRGNTRAFRRLMERANRLDPKGGRRKRGRKQRTSAPKPRKPKMKWVATVLSEQQTVSAAGEFTVRVRPQHHFIAKDITFKGSQDDTTISSVAFGDDPVFSSNGTAVGVFDTQSNIRGLMKGHKLRAGLDIVIKGTTVDDGDKVYVTIYGLKPARGSSC